MLSSFLATNNLFNCSSCITRYIGHLSKRFSFVYIYTHLYDKYNYKLNLISKTMQLCIMLYYSYCIE